MKKLFNVQAWQLSVAIYLPLIPSLGQQIQNSAASSYLGQFWLLPSIDTGMHAIFKIGFVGDSNK